jgi:hypothetical protein
MDIAKCESLKARCAKLGEAPFIAIDEFFDGNDDPASIGCNLDEHPGVDRFRSILAEVKKTPGVKEVLARISEVDPGEESWPFTDTICVVGEIDLEDLRKRVEPLCPTDVERSGLFAASEIKHLAKEKNAKVTVLWWD